MENEKLQFDKDAHTMSHRELLCCVSPVECVFSVYKHIFIIMIF